MSKVQTDNSYFFDKVMLRFNHLPNKDIIKVLDCYAGNNFLWDRVKSLTKKNIEYVGIDFRKSKNNLEGNNLKFIKTIDIFKYDIIDLDAYGVPYLLLKIILDKFQKIDYNKRKNEECVFFITFIQSLFGSLPFGMLSEIGYPKKMVKKIPTLFYKNGIEKFKRFLSNYGIKNIFIRSTPDKRKNYISFVLNK